MSDKRSYYLAGTIGSVAGGYAPVLFGVSGFSPWTLLTGAIGAILGIWLVYKFLHG